LVRAHRKEELCPGSTSKRIRFRRQVSAEGRLNPRFGKTKCLRGEKIKARPQIAFLHKVPSYHKREKKRPLCELQKRGREKGKQTYLDEEPKGKKRGDLTESKRIPRTSNPQKGKRGFEKGRQNQNERLGRGRNGEDLEK